MRLKIISPQKAFLLVLSLFLYCQSYAQSYQRSLHRIDSLADIGLPKSALAEVKKLDQQARRQNNIPMQIKAVIYRMTLQSYLEPNALVPIIDSLKADINKATYPAKPVLQSMLANMYHQYYNQNRWSFSGRTQQLIPSVDYTLWDLRTIINETNRLYQLSLADVARLQNTPIDVLDGVLTGDKATRHLRPTLYDMLAHRALEFYLGEEPALTKPKQPFTLNNAAFFGDADTFAKLQVYTTDTTSTWYRGIKLLQQITAFHLRKGNAEALADIDLQRLGFVNRHSWISNKDELYLQGLKKVAATAADRPVANDALVLLGTYYKERDSLITAMRYFKQAEAKFPESRGAKNAVMLIRELHTKVLSAQMEWDNIPNKPILASVIFRNVNAAQLRVYKLSKQDLLETIRPSLGWPINIKRLTLFTKDRQPIQQKMVDLKAVLDYKQHTTETKIDALAPGSYLLAIQEPGAADSTMQVATFTVSSMVHLARVNPNGDFQFKVMDRDSGEPLEGVVVKAVLRRWQDRMSRREFVDMKHDGVTDKNGDHIIKKGGNGQYNVQFFYKGDELFYDSRNVWGATDEYEHNEPDHERTTLFTDRQIYRPGQTIYFKGLQLQIRNTKSSIMVNREVEVNFNDANSKNVGEQTFKTNEFGTFAGQFVIPQNILSGRFTISTDHGSIEVKVEEYKRPTFKTEFLPVTQSYKLNDSLTIAGTVNAFSGYGLSGARVVYRVSRATMRNNPLYRWGPTVDVVDAEIAADTVVADSKGAFKVKFKAVPADISPDLTKYFKYTVNVDVTDAAGETLTASTSVNVGYNTLAIVDGIPEKLVAENAGKAVIAVNNLNAQRQNGEIRVQVYALDNPAVTYKPRLWYTAPDHFILSADEYKADFQAYAYRRSDDPKTWRQLDQVADVTVPADSSKLAYFDMKTLAAKTPGIYKVLLSAKNKQGDTTSLIKYITVLAESATPVQTIWVTPVKTDVKQGEAAEFLVNSDEAGSVLLEKYNGSKPISAQWISVRAGLQKIKVDVDFATGVKGYAVQLMAVRENRLYTAYHAINLKETLSDINIKLVSFKDKLQPGEKDQWKLQLSGNKNEKPLAEMVATMYDASLDDITAPQPWDVNTRLYGGTLGNRYFGWGDLVQTTYSVALHRSNTYYTLLQNKYETLNLFTYNYYGGFNNAYQGYLHRVRTRKPTVAERDKELEGEYLLAMAMNDKGLLVTGTVVDSRRTKMTLNEVLVSVKGTDVKVHTNSKGYFKLRVPKDGTLVFTYVGFDTRELTVHKAGKLNVKLVMNEAMLREVAVVGYATRRREQTTGASYIVTGREVIDEPVGNAGVVLQGKVAGLNIQNNTGAPGMRGSVNIRGLSTVNGKDLAGGDVNEALRNLPADILEKIQVVDGYGAQGSNKVKVRTNFNETAFFYPQLRTDTKGRIMIEFIMPESLTKWRFRGFAHTKALETAYIEQEVITQKTLSITANTPRFLREGDTLTVSARLANLSVDQQKGKIELQLFNALNMQPVKLLIAQADARQNFDIAAATTKAFSFKMLIPAGLDAITYRLTADAGKFSDGEENTLPVLPNRMLVTESMPMMVRAGQQKTFTFDKFINQNSSTLKNKTLTLEYTQNPAWYAVQALPYMMEFPYECSEQLFSRFYANSLGTDLVNKMPVIRSVFERWKATNSTQLLSNLEKNPELKSVLLEETPWLREAADEADQKKRISLLFDVNKMSYELDQVLEKLSKRQLPGGGFPWFAGDQDDRYITQHIIAGIGQLAELGIAYDKKADMKSMAAKAIAYLDRELLEDERLRKQRGGNADKAYIGQMEIHAWYAKSYFDKVNTSDMEALLNTYLKLAAEQWLSRSVYEQGMIALTMHRNGKTDVARAIIRSLKERAQQSEDLGMYWADNRAGWYWYQAPIETQSLMIELFNLVPGNQKEVEELKVWLLRNKQTSNWKSTKATAAAVYALLLKGDDVLVDNGTTALKLNGTDLATLKPDTKAEAGSGYIKTTWVDEQVRLELGKVDAANNSKIVSWGALHWQYFENLDKISSSSTDIKLERKYFIEQQGDAGKVLQAVDATHAPKVGDILKVVVYLKTTRDMEYIHLKDMRPAGTQPVDVLSAYKYQDGLYYYQVTKDVATNFFISSMKKGNYVFEYSLRVAQPGNFSTGISTVQNMYAPEFNAHSEGGRLLVK